VRERIAAGTTLMRRLPAQRRLRRFVALKTSKSVRSPSKRLQNSPHQIPRGILMKFYHLFAGGGWIQIRIRFTGPQKKNTDSGSHTTAASIFGFSARMFLIRSSRILCRPDENTTAVFDECSRHHKPVPRDPPVISTVLPATKNRFEVIGQTSETRDQIHHVISLKSELASEVARAMFYNCLHPSCISCVSNRGAPTRPTRRSAAEAPPSAAALIRRLVAFNACSALGQRLANSWQHRRVPRPEKPW